MPEPRVEFFSHMDAANIDLKAFSEGFYHKLAAGHLEPVLDTLRYVGQETSVWMELTTLVIPGWNDSEKELAEMAAWVVENLGPDVPLHFSAFHPDWKLKDVPATPPATLVRARDIARATGVRHVYTGNVHDKAGGSSYCHSCGQLLIGRDWYVLSDWRITEEGACTRCGTAIPGVFEAEPGSWGARRQPVRLSDFRT
jgi:pyruvate formate lyase activating enzyme